MCPLCVCKRARFWTRASARYHVRLRAHAQHTPRATHIARPYCSAQRTVTQTPPAQHTCTSRNMRHIAVTYTTKTKQQYSAPQQHDTARHGTDTQTRRSPRNMRHATHSTTISYNAPRVTQRISATQHAHTHTHTPASCSLPLRDADTLQYMPRRRLWALAFRAGACAALYGPEHPNRKSTWRSKVVERCICGCDDASTT